MTEKMGERVLAYREEIVTSLVRLIRARSVREEGVPGMPFGKGPFHALEEALDLAQSLGFTVKNVDGYAGHVEYGEGEDYVGVLAHLDVVPEGVGWTVPPYEGLVRDGCVIGRGASDDKGPAVAALYALKAIRDLEETPGREKKLKRKIRVILGCAEETGSEDMAYYFSKEPLPLTGFTPDCGYPAINREKGLLRLWLRNPSAEGAGERAADGNGKIRWMRGGMAFNMVPQSCSACLDETRLSAVERRTLEDAATAGVVTLKNTEEGLLLETQGVSAHAMAPQDGVNAILKMVDLLRGVSAGDAQDAFLQFLSSRLGFETNGHSLGAACSDEESGDLTLCVGLVSLDASEAKIALDIRYPVTLSGEPLVSAIRATAEADGFALEEASHSPPLYVPADSALIRTLQQAQSMFMEGPVEPLSMGGGTYARSLKGRGVGFGGAGTGAHAPDEHVCIDELMQHAQICTQAMYLLATT